MFYTQRLETHFPVHVPVREHHGLERMNAELHARIAEMRKLHAGTTLDAVFVRQCTTQGGFQTTPTANLFDDALPSCASSAIRS